MTKIDTRYPYIYACDFIRMLGPIKKDGVVLSRSDANQISGGISKAIGMEDEIFASKLADTQLNKTQEDLKKETDKIIDTIRLG